MLRSRPRAQRRFKEASQGILRTVLRALCALSVSAVGFLLQAAMPECRSKASMVGSRPRKPT
jgi:hypothetical protein